MMAIAQKCGLSLSALPCEFIYAACVNLVLSLTLNQGLCLNVRPLSFSAILEPGLMNEPCDWDVCTEAATPDLSSHFPSRTEKKRRAKPVTDQASEPSGHRRQEKTHPAPTQELHSEGDPRKIEKAPQAVPTRKELQDALPKIPPLSSFKRCRSSFMTFEEAEQDFESFINEGLGRSVEVIREFRGREDGGADEQNGHRESVILNDEDTYGRPFKSDFSRPRSVSGSSSSQSHKDDGEYRTITKPQMAPRQTPAVPQPKAETPKPKACTSAAPQTYPQTMCTSSTRAFSQPDNCESVQVVKSSRRPHQVAPAQTGRKESKTIKGKTERENKKITEKMSREHKREERDEGEDSMIEDEDDEDEEEWSAESYWRASYRAWRDYYASMSPYQEQGYQSYYSVAHNWMAAYRMNAVYMQELLKH